MLGKQNRGSGTRLRVVLSCVAGSILLAIASAWASCPGTAEGLQPGSALEVETSEPHFPVQDESFGDLPVKFAVRDNKLFVKTARGITLPSADLAAADISTSADSAAADSSASSDSTIAADSTGTDSAAADSTSNSADNRASADSIVVDSNSEEGTTEDSTGSAAADNANAADDSTSSDSTVVDSNGEEGITDESTSADAAAVDNTFSEDSNVVDSNSEEGITDDSTSGDAATVDNTFSEDPNVADSNSVEGFADDSSSDAAIVPAIVGTKEDWDIVQQARAENTTLPTPPPTGMSMTDEEKAMVEEIKKLQEEQEEREAAPYADQVPDDVKEWFDWASTFHAPGSDDSANPFWESAVWHDSGDPLPEYTGAEASPDADSSGVDSGMDPASSGVDVES